MNPNWRRKLSWQSLKTFENEEAPVVHFLTPTWLHISAPARSGRLGRGKCGEGPSLGGVTAFCHTACSTAATRWHFHKMALLNYAAQWKGKKGKGEKKAHFLGVCFRPKTATCFHQCLLPLMQNGAQGNRGTIKPAGCSRSLSPSSGWNDTVSPLHQPPSSPN